MASFILAPILIVFGSPCTSNAQPTATDTTLAGVFDSRAMNTHASWVCGAHDMVPFSDSLWPDGFTIASASFLPRYLGVKNVLVMPLDFPDLQGANTTETNVIQEMREVDLFYQANSFQQFSIGSVVVTPVLRMPKPSTVYPGNDPSLLLRDARDAAAILGYEHDSYEFDIVTFRHIGFPWGGIGYVGGKGAFIQGASFSRFAVAHELGHNLGNWHAGSWVADDDSIIGPGTRLDYGNDFDVMGAGDLAHFNANFKYLTGWLPDSCIHTVSNAGVYRIQAIDSTGALNLDCKYGIRIRIGPPSDAIPSDYWIDFRQQPTNNAFAMSGALIKRAADAGGPSNNQLLDMVPGSPFGVRDAPLPVGRTFTDGSHGISVTPVAEGDDGAGRWLDVMMSFGAPNLHPPVSALSASALTASPGEIVRFAATASDPDGDALAFSWDFGDRTLPESSLNQPSADKSWSAPGDYVVRCTVSDMKGGEASASVLVRIGNPPTLRISGRVLWRGQPLGSVRVHNGRTGTDYRGAYSDSDGRFTLVDLMAGNYLIGAVKPGFLFALAFTNPVSVGPQSVEGLVFQSETNTARFITAFVPSAGAIGSSVSIRGINLPIPEWPGVDFGGAISPYYFWRSFSEIIATVPEGAATGPVTLKSSWAGGQIITSATAFVVLPKPPGILMQPQSQTIGVGFNASFGVALSGSGPFACQWRKDGVEIPQATNVVLTIPAIQSADAGAYDIVVMNSAGVVTSTAATLSVVALPSFAEALDTTNLHWTTATDFGWRTQTNLTQDGVDAAEGGYPDPRAGESWLETTVEGPGRLRFYHYNWPDMGLLLRYGTSPGTLTNQVSLPYFFSAGWRPSEVRLPAGPQIVRWICRPSSIDPSRRVRLDQVAFTPGLPPLITGQPQPQTVPVGQGVTFEVRAEGNEPLSYQWFRTLGQPIPGATNRTYTIANPRPDDEGYYVVRVENTFGEVTSDQARLRVVGPPVPQISQPADGAEVPAGNILISVSSGFSEFYLTRVQVFDGTQRIADVSGSLSFYHSMTLSNVPPGRRLNLSAVVTDDHGQVGTSATVRISVVLPLIRKGGIWSYLYTGQDPGPLWREQNFNDSTWAVGVAPLGYPRERWNWAPITTGLDFGPDPTNKYVTAWFRRTFVAPSAGSLSNAVLWLRRDDGAVVYLNGAEAFRSNMPDGPIGSTTLASEATAGGEEIAFVPQRIPPHLFQTGTNVLAVEVHQSDPTSEDLVFDLSLTADSPPVPSVAIVSPGSYDSIVASAIAIRAVAVHPDGDIARVEFFADGIKIDEDATPPYVIVWSNAPPSRNHLTLSAEVTDTGGNVSRSDPVSVYLPAPEGSVLLMAQAGWRFLDDGSEPGANWRDADFDIENWPSGAAPLGNTPGASTVIDLGPAGARHPTIYFLAPLSLGVERPPRFAGVTLYLLSELADGVIVYMNGVEVLRRNLPEDSVSASTYTCLPSSDLGWIQAQIDPSLLGAYNIIAVEMHQNLPDSAQLIFDLAMTGQIDLSSSPVTIETNGEGLVLNWEAKWIWDEEDGSWILREGHLEEADSPEGPWRWSEDSWRGGYFIRTDVSQRFFRVRWP